MTLQARVHTELFKVRRNRRNRRIHQAVFADERRVEEFPFQPRTADK